MLTCINASIKARNDHPNDPKAQHFLMQMMNWYSLSNEGKPMQPFSKNPKLEDWNPSKDEIAEILEARKIWISLGKDPNYEIPEEQINDLECRSILFNPTLTDKK